MFREGNGSRMAEQAMKFLRDKIPGIEINPHMLSNGDFGVSVSFEYKKGSDYHSMIKFHGINMIPGYVMTIIFDHKHYNFQNSSILVHILNLFQF